MRIPALAAALLAVLTLPGSVASSASPAKVEKAKVEQLVATCRKAVTLALRTGDMRVLDAYFDNLRRYATRDRDEIIACRSYLIGAVDMVSGRLLPLDVD